MEVAEFLLRSLAQTNPLYLVFFLKPVLGCGDLHFQMRDFLYRRFHRLPKFLRQISLCFCFVPSRFQLLSCCSYFLHNVDQLLPSYRGITLVIHRLGSCRSFLEPVKVLVDGRRISASAH